MKKLGVNSFVGILFSIIAIFWLALIQKLPKGTSLAQYGPAFFPKIIVICIFIVSVVLIVQDVINKKEKVKFDFDKKEIFKVLGLILTLIIYLQIMPLLGYLVSTIVALGVALWLFGLRKKVPFALVMVVLPIAINIVFKVFLKVQLP